MKGDLKMQIQSLIDSTIQSDSSEFISDPTLIVNKNNDTILAFYRRGFGKDVQVIQNYITTNNDSIDAGDSLFCTTYVSAFKESKGDDLIMGVQSHDLFFFICMLFIIFCGYAWSFIESRKSKDTFVYNNKHTEKTWQRIQKNKLG